MYYKIIPLYGLGIILGIISGALAAFFQISVSYGLQLASILINKMVILGLPGFVTSMLVSMVLVVCAWKLVIQFAPEASGSGVQEIEGALLHKRPLLWKRVLPVKFIGGVMTMSANMVLGREGPTIHMGGNIGAMLGEVFGLSYLRRNVLIAAGAGAGLSAAFNAPVAGILLVIEELRRAFAFSFNNLTLVAISCVMATITLHFIIGPQTAISMTIFALPNLTSLWMFFLLGIIIGFATLIFNYGLMFTLSLTDNLSQRNKMFYIMAVSLVIGYLAYNLPYTVGGGHNVIEQYLRIMPSSSILWLIIIVRFINTCTSYSSGTPGGIFSPMLALGALIGLGCAPIFAKLFNDNTVREGMFAIAGMGALFAAAVRAPVTAIILVVEMTHNYSLILPLMVTCLTATTVMQIFGEPPIYTQLLHRTLFKDQY